MILGGFHSSGCLLVDCDGFVMDSDVSRWSADGLRVGTRCAGGFPWAIPNSTVASLCHLTSEQCETWLLEASHLANCA